MIHGIIYICPECRKVLKFAAYPPGYYNVSQIMCAEDGYRMKMILMTDLFVDQLLKGGVPHAD